MIEEEVTDKIIGAAIKVHNALGPGLLESAYRECLCYEILKLGLRVEKEKAMPLIYDEVKLNCGYRIDALVEGKVVVETKTVESFNTLHFQQVLTYLRLGNFRIGLLVNFNVAHLKDGLKRIVN